MSCLNVSEWALLGFGAVLVVGLVIEYRAEHGSRWMKFGEMLVIIGVAGELLGDGGIFLFSRHLQTISDLEIATLESSNIQLRKDLAEAQKESAHAEATAKGFDAQIAASDAKAKSAEATAKKFEAQIAGAQKDAAESKKEAEGFQLQIAQANERAAKAERETEELRVRSMPRRLAPAQRSDVASNLAFPGQRAAILMVSVTSEATIFSGDLEKALKEAHWDVSNVAPPPGWMLPISGVVIAHSSTERSEQAGTLLLNALTSQGISVISVPDTAIQPWLANRKLDTKSLNSNDTRLEILIGDHP